MSLIAQLYGILLNVLSPRDRKQADNSLQPTHPLDGTRKLGGTPGVEPVEERR